MRKLVDRSLCQPVNIAADSAIFTGWFEDESGYFSDASLYDADDSSEDDLFQVANNFRKTKICTDRKSKLSEESSLPINHSDSTVGATALSTSHKRIVKAVHKNGNKNKALSEPSADMKEHGAAQGDHKNVQKSKASNVAAAEKSIHQTVKKKHPRKVKFIEEDSSDSDAEAMHLPNTNIADAQIRKRPKEAAKSMAQFSTMKVSKTKVKRNGLTGAHPLKHTTLEAEDTGSASSHDNKVDVNAQGKLVTTICVSEDVKSKKKATAKVVLQRGIKNSTHERGESKSRKLKLADTVESEDQENATVPTKVFQKKQGHGARGVNMPNALIQRKGKLLGQGELRCLEAAGTHLVASQAKTPKLEATGTADSAMAEDGTSLPAKHLTESAKQETAVQNVSKGDNDLRGERISGFSQEGRSTRGLSDKHKEENGPVHGDVCASLESVHSAVKNQQAVLEKDLDNGAAGEEVSSSVTEGGEGHKVGKGDEASIVETAVIDVGWVLCDDCHKWRCIPADLADEIEATNCRWSCKENPNKEFADCTIPQEKSNAEINAELNISEVSFCEEDDEKDVSVDSKQSTGLQIQGRPQAAWTLIKHNIFQHRPRKTQTIDEIMVCGCVPPEDGGVGCGDDCLNRMLSIECIPQTCPCGDTCSNQQFQRRSYAKVGWFRCGKKGFGLQILEDVSKGTFIIEYVGEVLDMVAYEARQREYALKGQKHFYFMTLSSNEVIDACVKGNLGRFINHSCEPNCKTEKWMINGEVCIGLFAIRDLKKGEEITFDYNYVRVCGAAAKKCLCGSTECRGYIGGEPVTPRSIAESDSDEDDPEPIMVEGSSQEEDETQTESRKPLIDRKPLIKIDVSIPGMPGVKRKCMFGESSEKLGGSSKRVKTNANLRKLDITSVRRLTVETAGGRFDGVEEKLNEMLDENGGLCKRQYTPKDLATRYLKLLLVTAASGDAVNGEASRSTRDLSIVLDALLKTLSRGILTEIVNKNGLHILHNMIKQFRRNFQKTPIIRKLMKVLEFLAAKNILTLEQINAAPHHDEAESVRETIYQLCKHNDSEVQRIARRFREKYHLNSGQKPFRKQKAFFSSASDQHNSRLMTKQNQFQDSGCIGDTMYKGHSQTHCNDLTRKQKRPSRWDQPSQEVLDTTLAGGLPQSFWPFNASNLLGGKSQQDLPDNAPRFTESASTDQLRDRHPEPPTFPAYESQKPPANAYTEKQMANIVPGLPVGPFLTASPMGFVPQQVNVCVGIPVTQFSSPHPGGPDSAYLPQQHGPCNGASEGQHLVNSTPNNPQEKKASKECSLHDQASKGPDIMYGISPSQFFQQMHNIFGSVFHPWQLQALMAPHSWGPFLSGDARFDDSKSTMHSDAVPWQAKRYEKGDARFDDSKSTIHSDAVPWQAKRYEKGDARLEDPKLALHPEAGPWPSKRYVYNKSVAEELDDVMEYELEPEPPVPGLSPPHPQHHVRHVARQYSGNEQHAGRSCTHPQQEGFSSGRNTLHPQQNNFSAGRSTMHAQQDNFSAGRSSMYPQKDNFSAGRSNMHSQQGITSPWREGKWDSPRWSKFPGRKPQRYFDNKRDFGYPRRFNRHNFQGQRFSRPHVYHEDAFHRFPPNENVVVADAGQTPHTFYEDETFEEASPCMPLEKPWGFDQEEYYKEDTEDFSLPPGDFSVVKDSEMSKHTGQN